MFAELHVWLSILRLHLCPDLQHGRVQYPTQFATLKSTDAKLQSSVPKIICNTAVKGVEIIANF
jgi:hypothetical protein